MNELGKFLVKIDKDITREEIEYIFNKFDEDGNNQIEFDEFKRWLEKNEVKERNRVDKSDGATEPAG